MTIFGAAHDDDDLVAAPIDERQALLGKRQCDSQEDDETDQPGRREVRRLYESIDRHGSQGEVSVGSPAPTKRRRTNTYWHFRLAMISVGVVSASFVGYLWTRNGEDDTSPSWPGSLRSESTNTPPAAEQDYSSAEHEQTIEQNNAPSSSRFVLDDSVMELWEEWKVPAEHIRSGSVWKDSFPSFYHVWREMTFVETDKKPDHGRRLEDSSASSVAEPEAVSTKAPTPKPVSSTEAPVPITTYAPTTFQPVPEPAPKPVHHKAATPHISRPVAKPVATTSSGTQPTTTRRITLSPTKLAETKSPSSGSLGETIQEDEQEAESWLKHKWDQASDGAEKAWHKVSEEEQKAWHKVTDEEHTIVTKLKGNHTPGDQTMPNGSNETWVQEGEDWYHKFVGRLNKLGKHMRSWWVKTENATETESREIGDWLNHTEHELAKDERFVQDRFKRWWSKASAAEQMWWKETSRTFHDYAHQAEENERLWWLITRDTAKRDWDAVLQEGEHLYNETLLWEENVANKTSLYSRAAWNSSSNAAVQGWQWTIDEEQAIWHAIQHWYRAHATYQEEMLMPLLYFNNTESFSLLMNNYGWFDYSQDFFHMQEGFDAQINQAYCGVASVAAILNSLPRDTVSLPTDPRYSPYPYATQSSVLANSCVQETVVHHNETFDGVFHAPGGLTLEQTRNLLECHLDTTDFEIEVVHVDPSNYTLGKVRQDLRLALKDPMARVMINFDRRVLGQKGGGHFSPLGSYAEREDAFLIMDVAKYKYPPVWVPFARLFASMATVDKCGDWDFPQAQDMVRDLSEDEEKVYKHKSTYEKLLQQLNCEEAYRGYVIVRSGRVENAENANTTISG